MNGCVLFPSRTRAGTSVPDSAERERIRASGLFDEEYYRRTYGHLIAGDGDPLDHFLESGLGQGYLPSAGFDPLLYRVLVPESGAVNPLLHAAASGKPFEPPPLEAVWPQVAQRIAFTSNLRDPDTERHRAYAKTAADQRDLPFGPDGSGFTLRVPPPDLLLERLRADRPFAYARLPHGFWDAVWMLNEVETALAGDPRAQLLSALERHALAIRFCFVVRRSHGAFVPMFMEEALADIHTHAGNPDFFRAVSFKGYPTHEEDIYGGRATPPRDEVFRLFARYFRPDEPVYDGMVWKRLLIAGQLKELPALARARPVVLVANRHFGRLGRRWRLDDFTHITIPLRLSQWQRRELLARISEAVEAAGVRSGKPPLVITRCGGSLAFWFITRLFARCPRAFYLDLGQALNGWFLDLLDIPGAPWMRVYARAVIANCRLERFYRLRKGADYDAWLEGLP
jgi:hypothetical protein